MKTLILLSVILLTLDAHAKKPHDFLTPAEAALLFEVKQTAIAITKKQKNESEKLRHCFVNTFHCDPLLKSRLNIYRRSIKHKNEEYRILTALSTGEYFLGTKQLTNTPKAARLGQNFQPVHLGTDDINGRKSEFTITRQLGINDYFAISRESKEQSVGTPTNPYHNAAGYRMNLHIPKAREFYRVQALLAVQSVPFIIYLKNDTPTDREISQALDKYSQELDKVIETLSDEKKTPLISFLIYQPIMKFIIKNDKYKTAVFNELLKGQSHKLGIKAWLERNSPSLKVAALTACSFVGAVLQAWPLSLSCGGALVTLSSYQLYTDYHVMKEQFSLWLAGAQSHTAVSNAEARVMYSTLALFFAGQGVASAVAHIEQGLLATLSSLPQTAAARFGSIQLLREGSVRFANGTVQAKGKDLGASIFAEQYSEIIDPNLKMTRMERIFTYSDLIMLHKAAVNAR